MSTLKDIRTGVNYRRVNWAKIAYDAYNLMYWKAKLPDVPVHFKKLTGTKEKGKFGSTVFIDSQPAVIFIDQSLKHRDRVGRIILLHEMVHVSLPVKALHGPRHDRAIDRLVRLGAYKGLL